MLTVTYIVNYNRKTVNRPIQDESFAIKVQIKGNLFPPCTNRHAAFI